MVCLGGLGRGQLSADWRRSKGEASGKVIRGITMATGVRVRVRESHCKEEPRQKKLLKRSALRLFDVNHSTKFVPEIRKPLFTQ